MAETMLTWVLLHAIGLAFILLAALWSRGAYSLRHFLLATSIAGGALIAVSVVYASSSRTEVASAAWVISVWMPVVLVFSVLVARKAEPQTKIVASLVLLPTLPFVSVAAGIFWSCSLGMDCL